MSSKIKLAIDASRSSDLFQKTGVELVSDNLLKEISKQNSEIIFYTPKLIPKLPKENQKILKWKLKYLWTQLRLAFELFKNPPEKFFVLSHKIPFLFYIFNFSTQKNIIIHDIAFFKHPEIYPKWMRLYLNFDLKLTLKKCTKIFVPTQAVKNDILKHFPNKNLENKIIVIHHGYTPLCHSDRPLGSLGVEESLKHQNRKKQILFLGRIEEKKNIKNLISGFEIFSKKNLEYNLVLAGPNKMNLEVKNPKIKLLGYVSGEQKEKLLQESECLVLVSRQEGFGFPILEAWDYELPVLASDISVLKEVGGDACLFTNPNSISEIAEKIEKIVSDRNLQQDLIQKGSQRLENFNWQKSAERYLEEILK